MFKKREFLKNSLNFLIFVFFKFSIKANPLVNNTRVLSHPIFFKHQISKDHPESPDRIKIILEYLKIFKKMDLLEIVNTDRYVEDWILKIHTKKHINSLKINDPIAEEVSRYAVKICLTGVDKILQKESKNIFCAVRPPGHHALNTGKEEGFCYYNHIAITPRYVQKKYDLKKILIVDWDYHHGNSTEYFFYDDPNILFFSTHDQFAYPGTGLPEKKGKGKGYGLNVNVHLPCKTKDSQIIKAFNDFLIKKVNKFKPEFILISSGFDSRVNDLLGCFNVTDKGFAKLTKIMMKLAKEHCNNRILSILEGGYNIEGNAKAVLTHINELNNLN